jgi:hypothetical protein
MPSAAATCSKFTKDPAASARDFGDQTALAAANRLIDTKEGIVARDGYYRPRRLPNGEDPLRRSNKGSR